MPIRFRLRRGGSRGNPRRQTTENLRTLVNVTAQLHQYAVADLNVFADRLDVLEQQLEHRQGRLQDLMGRVYQAENMGMQPPAALLQQVQPLNQRIAETWGAIDLARRQLHAQDLEVRRLVREHQRLTRELQQALL